MLQFPVPCLSVFRHHRPPDKAIPLHQMGGGGGEVEGLRRRGGDGMQTTPPTRFLRASIWDLRCLRSSATFCYFSATSAL